MSDIMTIYAGKGRTALAKGSVVAHIEHPIGAITWIEIRRSGTGGPLSGPRIARFESGAWTIPFPDEIADLAAAALAAGPNQRHAHRMDQSDILGP